MIKFSQKKLNKISSVSKSIPAIAPTDFFVKFLIVSIFISMAVYLLAIQGAIVYAVKERAVVKRGSELSVGLHKLESQYFEQAKVLNKNFAISNGFTPVTDSTTHFVYNSNNSSLTLRGNETR